ncbi:MAG: shikimate kinase [Gammaproteobacteria bacterium]|nr:shikimate kinase [Gammaproteobacteria bacterium]
MIDPAGGEGAPPPPSRILLVGFMASGKSAVGREVAQLLGWRFVDLDDEIRRETGQEIPAIFKRSGEAGFREIEARAARRFLLRDRTVLAPGGGWAAQPGHMEELAADTLSVWLKVTAETAVARDRAQEGERPLLNVARPVERARRLLARRESYYRLARLTLDAEEYSVSALASRIARLARQAVEPPTSSPATAHSP